MDVVLSAEETRVVTPLDQQSVEEDRQIRYVVAVPTILTRNLWRTDMDRMHIRAKIEMGLSRIRFTTGRALEAELRQAVARLQWSEPLEEVLARVDRYAAMLAEIEADEKVDADDLAEAARDYAEVEQCAVAYDDDFAGLMQERRLYLDIQQDAAIGRFVVGWEGIDAPLIRDRHGLTAATLQKIPSEHRPEIFGAILMALQPSAAQAKN